MKQQQIDAAFLGLAVVGLLIVVMGAELVGGVMLGTAFLGWYITERRNRVTDDQLFEIENYANNPEEWR